MAGFDAILQEYYPVGENINDYYSGIVQNHLQDVLDDLPRRASLPMPDELQEILLTTRTCPVVIEETITVSAIQKHLAQADEHTREIGIDIFPSGTQVLRVGARDSLNTTLEWKDFRARSRIDFHTHPGSTDTAYNRLPSLGDLIGSFALEQPIAIGSHDGLTCVSEPKADDGNPTSFRLWQQYVADRGFTQESFDAYGGDRVYTEFIADVIRPHFLGWSTLGGEASLEEAILAQRRLYRPQ